VGGEFIGGEDKTTRDEDDSITVQYNPLQSLLVSAGYRFGHSLVATASSSSTIHHQTHTPPLPLSSQTIDFSRSPSIHPHPPLYVCVCKLLKTVVSGRRRRRRRRQAPLEEGGAPPRLYVAGPITQRPLPCCVCVCARQATTPSQHLSSVVV
jgi:hypothetical protein